MKLSGAGRAHLGAGAHSLSTNRAHGAIHLPNRVKHPAALMGHGRMKLTQQTWRADAASEQTWQEKVAVYMISQETLQ